MLELMLGDSRKEFIVEFLGTQIHKKIALEGSWPGFLWGDPELGGEAGMPGFPRATVFQLSGKEPMPGRGTEGWFKVKSRRKWSTMVSSLAALSSCTPRQLEKVL